MSKHDELIRLLREDVEIARLGWMVPGSVLDENLKRVTQAADALEALAKREPVAWMYEYLGMDVDGNDCWITQTTDERPQNIGSQVRYVRPLYLGETE